MASQWVFERYCWKSRRELLLDEMEIVVLWAELQSLVRPHYAKAGNGRQPVGLAILLRMYFVQQWCNLLDPGMKAHVGVDAKEGHVHTLVTTLASVAESTVLPDLLHGEERKVWVDGGY